MTDEEIIDAWKRRQNVKKPENVRMYDGRYNAAVLLGWVLEMAKTMTTEEFAAMNRLANEPKRREPAP